MRLYSPGTASDRGRLGLYVTTYSAPISRATMAPWLINSSSVPGSRIRPPVSPARVVSHFSLFFYISFICCATSSHCRIEIDAESPSRIRHRAAIRTRRHGGISACVGDYICRPLLICQHARSFGRSFLLHQVCIADYMNSGANCLQLLYRVVDAQSGILGSHSVRNQHYVTASFRAFL